MDELSLLRFRRAMGIDPGPQHFSYAIADIGHDGPGMIRYVEGGSLDSKPVSYRTVLGRLSEHDIIALETPSGFIQTNRGPAVVLSTARELQGTCLVVGEITGMARERGLSILRLPAEQVRLAIGVKRNGNDNAVKLAVQRFTVNLPPRTSNHVRDALAIAIVALWNPRRAEVA